jgi:hypothetical protein
MPRSGCRNRCRIHNREIRQNDCCAANGDSRCTGEIQPSDGDGRAAGYRAGGRVDRGHDRDCTVGVETVSGTGLRVIGLGSSKKVNRRQKVIGTAVTIESFRFCERYITISGLQQGNCDSIGSIDEYLDTLAARYGGQTKSAFDFNTAGPQTDYYRNIIENGAPEGERSEKFQEVVWHLANAGWSAEQMVDELAKYPNGIGVKYASRLLAEVTRSYEKWRARMAGASASAQQQQQQTSNAPKWLNHCQRDRKGQPLSNLANAMLAFRNDQAISGMLAYNEMYCGEVLTKTIGSKINLVEPRPVQDVDITGLQEWFQLNGLSIIGQDTVHKAVDKLRQIGLTARESRQIHDDQHVNRYEECLLQSRAVADSGAADALILESRDNFRVVSGAPHS